MTLQLYTSWLMLNYYIIHLLFLCTLFLAGWCLYIYNFEVSITTNNMLNIVHTCTLNLIKTKVHTLGCIIKPQLLYIYIYKRGFIVHFLQIFYFKPTWIFIQCWKRNSSSTNMLVRIQSALNWIKLNLK
jgi:hypothetical protein